MAKQGLEKFVMETMQRSAIHGADYNPRKISADAREKLGKDIREMGMLMPIVVNKRTWNVVGGHQRMDIMDDYYQGEDYTMQVAVVDLSERDEVRANLMLNNQSMMGEWDPAKLADLSALDMNIDLVKDAGFTKLDLEFLFSGDEDIIQAVTPSQIERKEQHKQAVEVTREQVREARRVQVEKAKAETADGTADQWVDKDDYMLTFVFDTNSQKAAALKRLGVLAERGRYVPGHVLDEILLARGSDEEMVPIPGEEAEQAEEG